MKSEFITFNSNDIQVTGNSENLWWCSICWYIYKLMTCLNGTITLIILLQSSLCVMEYIKKFYPSYPLILQFYTTTISFDLLFLMDFFLVR